MSFQWINTPEALTACTKQWLTQPYVAIDTEFFRERTYYAALGLIQIAGDEGVALIDPLAITTWPEILQPLMLSVHTEKVFHSGEEDLEIFARVLPSPPVGVVDSQFLNGLLTAQPGISYINLVAQQLEVTLEKSQTRSDWMQRPLSDAQCHYAAADVHYLHRMYAHLRSQVATAGRWSWMVEEGAAMAQRAWPKDPSQYYLNLRQGADLRGNRLWLLQQLAWQRELRCQHLDRFRKGLISDSDLVLIARHRPGSARELALLVETRPSVLRHEQDWVLSLIKRSHTVSQADYPPQIVPSLPRAWSEAFKVFKRHIRESAEAHHLPPEYLSRKQHLETFFWHWINEQTFVVPSAWQGWRWQLLDATLLQALPTKEEALAMKEAT